MLYDLETTAVMSIGQFSLADDDNKSHLDSDQTLLTSRALLAGCFYLKYPIPHVERCQPLS